MTNEINSLENKNYAVNSSTTGNVKNSSYSSGSYLKESGFDSTSFSTASKPKKNILGTLKNFVSGLFKSKEKRLVEQYYKLQETQVPIDDKLADIYFNQLKIVLNELIQKGYVRSSNNKLVKYENLSNSELIRERDDILRENNYNSLEKYQQSNSTILGIDKINTILEKRNKA